MSGDGPEEEEVRQPPPTGKTDLLLRFFDSQFFDEWIALTYLYKSTSPGVQDYLCNRLYNLPEKGLERYLSQLCQLIISRPHSSLERVMVDLCARSLRIAVKVYWLLLAISQDQQKNTYAADLRDQCERAALEGYWEPPFRDPKLLPMSPPRMRWLVGSPRSPIANGSFKLRRSLSSRFGSPEPFLSPPRNRDSERPMSPEGLGGEMYSSYSMGQGLEGLICASPSAVRSGSRADPQRHRGSGDPKARGGSEQRERASVSGGRSEVATDGAARAQGLTVSPTQETGNWPKELSPPSSPRLRQTTFGATLDFIEALCDASSGLTAFAPEDRQWALRKGLEEINKEIELASSAGVACWFPMGSRNERIVRLAGKEAVLLNSREKAPFMLLVEVLGADGDASESESESQEAQKASDEPVPETPQKQQESRTESHATAGPGPGSEQKSSPQNRSPPKRQRSSPVMSVSSKSLPNTTSPLSWKGSLTSFRSNKERESGIKPKAFQSADDSFTRGLKTAMEGLQGSGPLVSVTLEVENGQNEFVPTISEPSASSTASSYTPTPHDVPLQGQDRPSRTQSRVGVIHEDDDVPFGSSKGIGLLCTWAVCRAKGETGDRERSNEPYVKVHLKVHGGVDLRLSTKPHTSHHRRVPSDEAILRMAAQQRVRPPDPRTLVNAGSAPLPDLTALPRPSSDLKAAAAAAAIAAAATAASGDSQIIPVEPPETGEEGLSDRLLNGGSEEAKKHSEANAVFGERFWQKWDRIKGTSPYGSQPGWAVRPIMVKSGDDCRQELLAAQLIDSFYAIFHEAQLPLYLRPYEVLVTSNRTALIEMVPDSLSLHQLKAKGPPSSSLADFFFAKFVKGSPGCEQAQRNFAESMAAYSIVCYLLQIKDRHNGNILMDDEGHLIHIDFGFMLSNSPGGVNFEAAPFKLTRELLEILDSNAEGRASEMFDYFKLAKMSEGAEQNKLIVEGRKNFQLEHVLCIQGFLACRKHADRIILLVEMMQSSGCPCFKAGPRAVTALRKRFHLTLPESQCVEVVLGLISDSVDAWRTRQYDQYQRVMNGIL